MWNEHLRLEDLRFEDLGDQGEEVDPEFTRAVKHVLCYEMDEKQAAVIALRHIWGMDDLQVINHTGLAEADVRRLASEGTRVLMDRLFNSGE